MVNQYTETALAATVTELRPALKIYTFTNPKFIKS